MLNELITSILNTYLGKYVDNFNPAQLSVALLSGEVELENLPIRRDALFNLGIPVEIISGSIGKIKLQIPIRQFRTSPLSVNIENLHCVLGPKQYNYCDCCGVKPDKNYKRSMLDDVDAKYLLELKQAESYYVNSYSNWLNFGTMLVTKLVENLELKISDICIVYRDKSLVDNKKFAIGIIMQSFISQSFRNESANGEAAFKEIQLTNLSIFLDYRILSESNDDNVYNMAEKKLGFFYLMKPISAKGLCGREKLDSDKPKLKDVPQLSVELEISNIEVSINAEQCQEICSAFRRLTIEQKKPFFHTKRPKCNVKNNARIWWQYYSFCCGFEIKNKDEKLKIMHENLKFLKLYYQYLSHPHDQLPNDVINFKENFEATRSLYELLHLRKTCFDLVKAKNSISTSKNSFHWFPNLMRWNTTVTNENTISKIASSTTIRSEENKISTEILSAIETSLETENLEDSKLPTMVQFKITFNGGRLFVNESNLNLYNSANRLELNIEKFIIMINLHSYYYKFGFSVGSLTLTDYHIKHKPFQLLLQSKLQSKGRSPCCKSIKDKSQSINTDNENNNLFNFSLEKIYFAANSEYSLKISSRSIDIIYNKQTCDWIINFLKAFNNPLKKAKKSSLGSNWINNILKLAKKNIFASVNIEIAMPKIIVIDSIECDDPDSVLLDFGDLKFHKKTPIGKGNSIKASHNFKLFITMEEEDLYVTPCSTPPASITSNNTSPDMHTVDFVDKNIQEEFTRALYEKIYDKNILIFQNVKIFVCKFKDAIESTSFLGRCCQLLDIPFLSFQIERRMIKILEQGYPILNIQFKIPDVQFQMLDNSAQILNNMFLNNDVLSRKETDESSTKGNIFPSKFNGIEIDLEFGKLEIRLNLVIAFKMRLQNLNLNMKQYFEKTLIRFSLSEFIIVDQNEWTAFQNSKSDFWIKILGDSTDASKRNHTNGQNENRLALVGDLTFEYNFLCQHVTMTISVVFNRIEIRINDAVLIESERIKETLQYFWRTNRPTHPTSDSFADKKHRTFNFDYFLECSVHYFNISLEFRLFSAILNLKKTFLTLYSAPKIIAGGTIVSINIYDDIVSAEKLILSMGIEDRNKLCKPLSDTFYAMQLKISSESPSVDVNMNLNSVDYYHSNEFITQFFDFFNEYCDNKEYEPSMKPGKTTASSSTYKISIAINLKGLCLVITSSDLSCLVIEVGILEILLQNKYEEAIRVVAPPRQITFYEVAFQQCNIYFGFFRDREDCLNLNILTDSELCKTYALINDLSFDLIIRTEESDLPKEIPFFCLRQTQMDVNLKEPVHISLSNTIHNYITNAIQTVNKIKEHAAKKKKGTNDIMENRFKVSIKCDTFFLILIDEINVMFTKVEFCKLGICISIDRAMNTYDIQFQAIKVQDEYNPKPSSTYKLGLASKFEIETFAKSLHSSNWSSCQDLSSESIIKTHKNVDCNSTRKKLELFFQQQTIDDNSCANIKYAKNNLDAYSRLTFDSTNLSFSTVPLATLLRIVDFFSRKNETQSNYTNPVISTQGSNYKMLIKSFHLCIIEKEDKKAQVKLKDMKIILNKHALQFVLYGSIRCMLIKDVSRFGRNYSDKFFTLTESQVYFCYKRDFNNDLNHLNHGPFVDNFNISLRSISYIHSQRFLSELIRFIGDFLSHKKAYSHQVSSENQQLSCINLNITVKAATFLIPVNAFSSSVCVIDLGLIKIRNNKRKLSTQYELELRELNSYTSKVFNRENFVNLKDCNIFGSYVLLSPEHNILKNASGITVTLERVKRPMMTKISSVLSNMEFNIRDSAYIVIKRLLNQNFGEALNFNTDCDSDTYSKRNKTEIGKKRNSNLDMKINLENIFFCFSNDSYNFLCLKFYNVITKTYQNNELLEMSVRFRDIQAEMCKTKEAIFKTLPMKTKDFQIKFHWKMKKSMRVVTVEINNSRIILRLDSLKELLNYINASSSQDTVCEEVSSEYQLKNLFSNNSTILNIETNVNIRTDNLELAFTENTSLLNRNAIIFRICGSLLRHPSITNRIFDINISSFEICTASLSNSFNNNIIIVESFPVKCNIVGKYIKVYLNDKITIILSYRDIKLIIKIITDIIFYINKFKNESSSEKSMQIQKNIVDLMKVYHEENVAPWKESLQAKASHVLIYIIDDCGDINIPLLQLSLQTIELTHENSKNSIAQIIDGCISFHTTIDYYNINLSGWEPFLEPWSVECKHKNKLALRKLERSKMLSFNAKQRITFNFSTTFCELVKHVSEKWYPDYNRFLENMLHNVELRQRSPYQVFLIKNLTGEDFAFKLVLSQQDGFTCNQLNQKQELSDWINVSHGEKTAFEFNLKSKLNNDFFRRQTHQLLIQFQGWSVLGPISIEKVSTFFECLISNDNGEKINVVVDISLIGYTQKFIVVRSAYVIINKLETSLFLKMESKTACEKRALTVINAGLNYHIPLRFTHSSIFMKPISLKNELKAYQESLALSKLDYILIDTNIDNQVLLEEGFAFTKTELSLPLSTFSNTRSEMMKSSDINGRSFFYVCNIRNHCYTNQDAMNNLNDYKIRMKSPLKIINLLCCELTYFINSSIKGCIPSSKTAYIHMLNISESFLLEIEIDNYKISGKLRLSLCKNGIFESKIKLIDKLERILFLRISVHTYDSISYQISITAPIWILNKTSLPLIFRQEGTNSILSGQFEENESACQKYPLMASFSDSGGTPSLEMRLGKSFQGSNIWCKGFSMQNDFNIRYMRSENSKKSYILGIKTTKGREYFALTYFISIVQQYQVWNNSSHTIKLAQKCNICLKESDENIMMNAKPGTRFPFHWSNYEEERLYCIKLSDVDYCHWSQGIPLNEVEGWFINIRNDFGEMFFIRIETICKGPMFLIIISDATTIPPPIRLENYSDILIHFSQVGTKPNWRTIVRPNSSLGYALDDPLGQNYLNIEAPGGNATEVNIQNVGTSLKVRYENFKYVSFSNQTDSTVGYHESNHWVVGVKDSRVIVTKKKYGDRSQLWLLNSLGQMEHIGSSPSIENVKKSPSIKEHLVLDIDGTPTALGISKLILRPPNRQRASTQTWRFENGRLMCLRNMCLQALGGNAGLFEGNDVVLGTAQNMIDEKTSKPYCPYFQSIEPSNFRAGSGCLEISCVTNGPIKSIIIRDIENPPNLLITPEMVQPTVSQPETLCYLISLNFDYGVGISLVAQYPTEELAFLSLEKCHCELSTIEKNNFNIDFQLIGLQIDNQLLDTPYAVALKMVPDSTAFDKKREISLKIKYLFSEAPNIIIFDSATVNLYPCYIFLDESFILKLVRFFEHLKNPNMDKKSLPKFDEALKYGELQIKSSSPRYYFGNLYISPMQIRLSAMTASKISKELLFVKNRIGLTLINFEDAVIDFEKFTNTKTIGTFEFYKNVLKVYYIDQIKWHAASILGCVDFLGNPLGFASDISEGLSSFIFEGSVKSLVKNITHGVSNSTAKLTESMSESLVKIILDEDDNEARQKLLDKQSNNTISHLKAGMKGLGFGLLGGFTSLARHTYLGAQNDGLGGLINGVGKGIIGTVAKPIIGILDLASETASALRETSKSSTEARWHRKRLPRCSNGVHGDLLPVYSKFQSKGQLYLYIINNKNFNEKLIYYEPDIYNYESTKLRMLISNEYVRIFSFYDSFPMVTFECHLSEVLSCHPISKLCISKNTRNEETILFFIEISTNLPKMTRPRIRCQSKEISERSARYINFAKIAYEENKQSVSSDFSS